MGRQKRYAIGGWSKQNQRLWEGRIGTQFEDGLSETIGYGKEKNTQLDDGLSKTTGYGKAETVRNLRMV